MKVALCIFGQPRVINNPYTHQSHLDHIINKYNTDIFIHTWISGEEESLEYSDWVDKELRTVEQSNSTEIILEKYNPKKYIFEKPKKFQLSNTSRNLVQSCKPCPAGGNYWSLNNENNTLSHLYSLTKSIQLIDDKYDWVILSRYDNYITNLPDLNTLNSNNLFLSDQYSHFTDVLIFGGYEQIKTLACYDDIPNLCNDIKYFIPEEFKRSAFQTKYETEVRIPIGVSIARSNTLSKLQ
tara:strand:+ start:3308 stop:4024 length:717 start_codon:yes stop_codon:yes gene_type:complete